MKPEGLVAVILAKARELNLEILLAGGHAVISHGVPRNTFDLDLIISKDQRPAWLTLFRGIGYSIFSENLNFTQLSIPDSAKLPVDLMLVNHMTFGKLLAAAIQAPSYPPGVKVVSLRHLLALKCHAIKFGHRSRIEKDMDDVIRLTRNNHVDLNQPEIRELIFKHGTQELYEKLVRAIKL